MKYMGSKNRIAKEILPIILKDRKPNQYFVDLFCGGCNIVSEVQGLRIANDNNEYLISMWIGLQNDIERPLEIGKEIYNEVRNEYNNRKGKFTSFIIGWVGYMASANGRFFEGGYSGTSKTKIGTIRDYIKESINNIEKQIPQIRGVEFSSYEYDILHIPKGSIIYCDIPYKGTKQYSTSKNFDYEKFYNWCRFKKTQGFSIFISEYDMPNDFICIWEKQISSSLSSNGKSGGNKLSTEKLFTL